MPRILQAIAALFPPDPGALRLLAALRATLAGLLSFLLVALAGLFTATTAADRILGFAIALFIAATVRDPTARQRLVTVALAPLAGFTASVLAALLYQRHLAAAAIVPPLMFVVAYGNTRGPRYGTLGIVGLISYFIGLLTGDGLNALPHRLLVLLLAASAAMVVLFVVLPVRPRAELARLHRAIHADIARVLGRIGRAVAAGSWTDPDRAELHGNVFRLGNTIMLAQARVAALVVEVPGQGNRWLQLLAIELGMERIARIALRDLGPPADRPVIIAGIEALQRGADVPPPRSTAQLAIALGLLGHIMHELPTAAPTPAAPPPPNPMHGARAALQTALASALAIAGGELVSPNRWYWAAFAAFVMFQGTRSRGESLAKGAQFVAGTLAGVVAGTLVATLLAGDLPLMMIAIVAAVFLAFQANVAAYGVMVFWITIILALVFGMLGYFPPDLLLLRLEESVIGAACGALVASLVAVRREQAATQEAAIAFLRGLGQAVDSAARSLIEDSPRPELAASILASEQRFRELSDIAHAGLTGLAGTHNEPLRRRMLLLEACEQWARELGEIALHVVKVDDPDLARTVRQNQASIAASLGVLVSRLGDPAAPPASEQPAGDIAHALADAPSHRAVRLLLRIDAGLRNLASQPSG